MRMNPANYTDAWRKAMRPALCKIDSIITKIVYAVNAIFSNFTRLFTQENSVPLETFLDQCRRTTRQLHLIYRTEATHLHALTPFCERFFPSSPTGSVSRQACYRLVTSVLHA